MPDAEKFLFSEKELSALRQGFYTQAPTVAAMLLDDDGNTKDAAELTVELIESLVEVIGEVVK